MEWYVMSTTVREVDGIREHYTTVRCPGFGEQWRAIDYCDTYARELERDETWDVIPETEYDKLVRDGLIDCWIREASETDGTIATEDIPF